MRFCNNCGFQVDESFKFCPKCGSQLSFEEKTEVELKNLRVKICDVCGEENSLEADECNYCGAGFTGKEKVIEKVVESKVEKVVDREVKKEATYQPKEKFRQSKKKKTSQTKTEQKTEKNLKPKQILIFTLVIIAIGSILIYYGFESSTSRDSQVQNPQMQIESKIDLNAINEINQLENELKNDPNNEQKILRLANLSHDAGFFEKAISYYEKYLQLNPKDNDAEVDMGVCYFELKQYDKASSIFENVIKKNPRHQIAYLNLGIVNLTQANLEKAKEYFQKCIELGENTDAGKRAKELLKSH